MAKPQMDTEELNAPSKPRFVELWRGNNMQGFQLNVDPARGKIGQVLPTIIQFPTSARHQPMVAIERTQEDGTVDTEQVSMRDWKGFRPAAEAKNAKPKREWVLYYLEVKLKEIEIQMREANAKPEEIRAEQVNWTNLVYEANEIGPAPKDLFASASSATKGKGARAGA